MMGPKQGWMSLPNKCMSGVGEVTLDNCWCLVEVLLFILLLSIAINCKAGLTKQHISSVDHYPGHVLAGSTCSEASGVCMHDKRNADVAVTALQMFVHNSRTAHLFASCCSKFAPSLGRPLAPA